MVQVEQRRLAATTELILLHVDLGSRRGRPMPDAVQANIDAVLARHRQLPWPEQAGRVIGIRSRRTPG